MNVLILGSGGREHALCHAVSKSKKLRNLYVMPGNPGMAECAVCIDGNPLDNAKVREFVRINKIDLVIPGSEVYLENGISDIFADSDTIVFGPTQQAAKIESSKEFAKNLMHKYNIPTAKHHTFSTYDDAMNYVTNEGVPIVIKYDGLAGGKGVVVAMTFEEAKAALNIMLVEKKYGDSRVIVEEYLEGPEFSLMSFVHNETVIPMPIAQDHKRLLENDLGPNTGGMGAYSPVPMIPESVIEEVIETIIKPTVRALVKEMASFTGFLYGGLMLTTAGPKVIEFNARFGDPEAEVILLKLDTDILEIIVKIVNNKSIKIKWNEKYYVGVVLASKGYPNSYQKGFAIDGIKDSSNMVYHMGTKLLHNQIVSNGGRVLLVTGEADNLKEAIENAYKNVEEIKCSNLMFRSDIGKKST
jgi:phosphoribosylamine--glycine ligase